MGKLKGAKSILSEIQGIVKEYNAAEKAGDIEAALAKNEQLKEAIRSGVNSPDMPRAKPLTTKEIQAHAERMAPQVAGQLTRKEKSAQTIAGKTQQQFKKEQNLPVNLEVMEGKVDPRGDLPFMTLEPQKGGVLMGLPGDPTLARMNLKGIGDVDFDVPVGLHGGPRYGDDEKLWASNLGAASNFLNASQRASQQYGGAPVYASFMKMPSGFGFAQHYLESLLQYQRPDKLAPDALEKLNEEIRKGYVKDKKRVTFPEFAGFENPDLLKQQTLEDPNLRKHIASRLEASKKSYGLRPAEDVQFAVSHPELTNLETGAGGFTIGKVNELDPLTKSEHPTYSHDIAGNVLGQTRYATPYDLLYRDQLQLIKENPRSPEFNTLKLLGARQKIDEQLINELNEYQERMRLLIGKKDGGEVHMGKGGMLSKGVKALEEAMTKLPKGSDAAKAKIEQEFAEEAARKAGLYAGHTLPTETGKQAIAQAKQTLTKQPPVLKVKPPSDNILNVRQSNFNHSRPIGNETVNIDELSGGVRLSDPNERKRVDELASKISSPDGYISRIIVDQDNNVIEGQHRLEALRQLGVQDVPVYKIEDLEASMPVDKMRDAMNEVGAIHPDYVHQLLGHALDHISEVGIDEARKMNYGKYQQYYDAALNAIQSKAHGGVVHMAEGSGVVRPRKYVPPSQLIPIAASQEFPLQKPANVTEADMTPTEVHPLAGMASRGIANVHEFVSKPFGFPNPPMEMASDLMGLPAISKTLENYAYGTPNVTGSGQATRLNEEATDALMSLPFGSGQTIKAGVKSAVKGAKELAPTAGKLAKEFAEKTQFGMPLELNVVPLTEGAAQAAGKAAEVKAPANDLGFYSTVEKAALNLQRKSGNGDAFLSDLMKNQGVSQAKLDETGLTAALKGRKGVTRDEVQKLAAEGKIPLKERVVREFDEDEQSVQNHREKIERLNDKTIYYGRSIDDLNAELKKSVDRYGADNAYASQIRDKIKLMEEAYQQTYDELTKLNRVDLQENSAKYGPKNNPSYNTEGGENYREILIKTPENVAEPIDTSGWKVVANDENKYTGQRDISILDAKGNIVAKRSGYRGSDYDAINNAAKTEQKYQTSQMNFDRSHHSDPNILMHLRVADHVDADGKKGLLIDELQSDWHQQGRDKGYGKKLTDMPKMSADELYEKHFDDLTPAQKEYLEGFMQKWEAADYNGKQDELDKLTNQYQNWTNKQNIGSGVLDAPFKEDWYQIGLKRAIKEATDNGMDRVYLTTGKTQADRYDLSRQISKVDYDEMGALRAYDKNGAQIISEAVPIDKLSEYVGKDLAKKIAENAEKRKEAKAKYRELLKSDAPNDVVDVAYKEYLSHPTEYSGLDLQVGGEGMKQYYDKTYLNWLKKYAKQHNAEVGMTTLEGSYKKRADLSGKEMHDMEEIPEFKKILDEEFAKMDPNNPSMNKPWDAALKRFGGAPVYYIDLNPALKNTAKKGQAFAGGGAVQSPNDFDYESHVNKLMDAHNLSNFDYEGHVKKIMGMAEGGAAYNTSPDMSDGGLSIQAPSFKIGGRIPLITR